MLQFNDSNIIVGEIKQLLKTFNLPKCAVWTPGMLVFAGCCYITASGLYRALNTGRFNEIDKTNFVLVRRYAFGDKILNVTKHYELNSLIYDSYCHKYLGEYLRFIRDMKGIDLMSMYNCFSNEQTSNVMFGLNYSDTLNRVYAEGPSGIGLDDVFLADTDEPVYFEADALTSLLVEKVASQDYCIYCVPVKMFKQYTIGIDCDATVEIMADFYAENRQLTIGSEDAMTKLHSQTYIKYNALKFNKPILYSKLMFDASWEQNDLLRQFYLQEKNLKLYIKVPVSCKSSIVVLEGDYRNGCDYIFDKFNKPVIANLPLNFKRTEVVTDKTGVKEILVDGTKRSFVCKHQLLNINSGTSHPIADRLLEFICGNVITGLDPITENISRVQEKLENPVLRWSPATRELVPVNRKGVTKYRGIWEAADRNAIYDDACDLKLINKTFDITGYVDKDIEGSTIIGEYDYGK